MIAKLNSNDGEAATPLPCHSTETRTNPDRIMPSARAGLLRWIGDASSDARIAVRRKIDDPAANERTTVIDAALDGMASVTYRHDTAKGPRPMRAGQAMVASAIIGSKAGLGPSERSKRRARDES